MDLPHVMESEPGVVFFEGGSRGKCGHNVADCRMPVEWVRGHQL